MNTTVAQHPYLWLLLAFLLGFAVEWLLEVFYFRRPLADARIAARRRGEELDSERFAHGRTQADLKARLAELDTAQKGRTLAESLLAAARTKLTAAEAQVAESLAQRNTLEQEIATATRRAEAEETARQDLDREALDLRLRLAEAEAARLTDGEAAQQLRVSLNALQTELDTALGRLPALESEAMEQAAKSQALEADLQAAMRRHADAESTLAEVRGALSSAQDDLTAARKCRRTLEDDVATLTAKVQKLELSAADAKSAGTGTEQKLKARIEEVKQLTGQLGEAAEELAQVKAKAAQLEANLAAAQSTRKTLEKELAARPAVAEIIPSASDPAELAAVRDQLQEQERVTASWRSKAEEIEAELLATSRAHQALESELEKLRSAGPAAAPDASLAAELEAMTNERNQLAAELAALKPGRRKR